MSTLVIQEGAVGESNFEEALSYPVKTDKRFACREHALIEPINTLDGAKTVKFFMSRWNLGKLYDVRYIK